MDTPIKRDILTVQINKNQHIFRALTPTLHLESRCVNLEIVVSKISHGFGYEVSQIGMDGV